MIVVYGTVCLDLIHRVSNLPPKGGYVDVQDEFHALGGEAANTSASLRRWGADVQLVGNPLGQGPEAELLAALLRHHGLEDATLPWGDHSAPVCHILVTPDGERTMFGRGFVEMEQRGDPSLMRTQEGAWFTTDPNHGAQARAATEKAHEAGMNVYLLDFVRDEETVPQGCYWQSSTVWVGERGNLDVNKRWLEGWLKKHDCIAILTDGVDGFLLGTRAEGIRHYPAYDIPDAVDSTGAGDMFRAGMLFGLEMGWELPDTLQYAAVAAALNCRGLGAIGGLEDRTTIERHVKEHAETGAQYQVRV